MDELQARFDDLQRKLVPLWHLIGRSDPGGVSQEDNTIVVVPSRRVDPDLKSSLIQSFEERMLFMLFLLRQPHVRLIYVTSQAIRPEIIDYYLHILPGVVPTSARKRLVLLSPLDGSPLSLTAKLLERPRLISQIRALIPDLDRAHLVPYTTTDQERELAVRLGIPMYATDPRFYAFGTKSGCRRVFAEEGVAHPLGFEDLRTAEDLIAAVIRMRSHRHSMRRAIVKLNEGALGMGNAILDLQDLPPPGARMEPQALAERLRSPRFELPKGGYEEYIATLREQGGVVEELIDGEEVQSPSVQLRVTPTGELELLSTHDQILGGPSGQTYTGARFPANRAYAPQIMNEAAKIGRRFAKDGIIGRFALDFVVVRQGAGTWEAYAIEVNLRKGGTTHPFLTLQYLTDGRYDAETGVFSTARGAEKCYVASDRIESPRYRTFTPDDLLDIVSSNRLHFDHTSQTGVVLHMFSAVGDTGRLGLTAIADSHKEADRLYRQTMRVLDQKARVALEIGS